MIISHIALHYANEEQADIFFGKVLGLKQEKEFVLSPDFSKMLFSIRKNIKVKVFSNNKTVFEIFITDIKSKMTFEHVCLSIYNVKGLIRKCKRYGIIILTVKRNSKEYLFIKDPTGYLYEIKEIK